MTFESTEWDRRTMSVMNPDLDYSAPELVNAIKCDVYADIYSIGLLSYALFNDYKPIFENKSILDNFNKNAEKVTRFRIFGNKKFKKLNNFFLRLGVISYSRLISKKNYSILRIMSSILFFFIL